MNFDHARSDLQSLLNPSGVVGQTDPTGAPGWRRRDWVRAGAGVGFAAAVSATLAQTTIRTPSDGLTVGEVMIPAGDIQLPAYRAAPAGAKATPLILVVSEIFGVHEHIADVCRRFARLGYTAVAPELFVRQGDASSYGEIAKLLAEVISRVPDEQVMRDLDATVAWAASEGVDTRRLGITGFCWGGRITWLYAAHQPAVKAGVAWYGRLSGTSSALQPRHPVEVASQLKAPVLGLYGEADTGIPMSDVHRMRGLIHKGSPAALKSAIVSYPDAPHAFHADYRATYRAEAAEDGWRRCVGWLREHGAA